MKGESMSSKWKSFLIGVTTTLLVLLIFFMGIFTGYVYSERGGRLTNIASLFTDNKPQDQSTDQVWKVLQETYQLINQEYYGRPVDGKKLLYGAAEGMVGTLGDPYSTFLPPQQAEYLQQEMSGKFEGIGVYVEFKGKQPVIVAPIDNSPAEKAGLRRGDIIVAVNGEDVSKMDSNEVISKIRGPKGTPVTLTIKRGDKTFDVKIYRADIKVPQVSYQLVTGNIGYIRVTIFGDNTTSELDKAINQAQKDKVKGVILDLRDNGGGWVQAAREMLGRFLNGGVAMYEDTTKGPGGEHPLDVITGKVSMYDLPMVVLVNKGTASASEIVSGALQARGRAELVGEKTFGKGSEQRVHTMADGSSVHITVAHWLTPDKKDINGKGLTPDYIVKSTEQDNGTSGPQFEKAIEVLKQKIANQGFRVPDRVSALVP